MAVGTKDELKKRLTRARTLVGEDPAGSIRELQGFFELLVWQDPRDPEVQAAAEVGRDLLMDARERMVAAGLRGPALGSVPGEIEGYQHWLGRIRGLADSGQRLEAIEELEKFFMTLDRLGDPDDPAVARLLNVARRLAGEIRGRMATATMGDVREGLIGLSKMGVDLWIGLQAIFGEHAVAAGEIEGEPAFISSPEDFDRIGRRWKEFWQQRTGHKFEPLYVEILGELTDSPRRPEDIAKRVVKKSGAKRLSDVGDGVRELLKARVLTRNPERIFVVNQR
jgi:hypothetical protein